MTFIGEREEESNLFQDEMVDCKIGPNAPIEIVMNTKSNDSSDTQSEGTTTPLVNMVSTDNLPKLAPMVVTKSLKSFQMSYLENMDYLYKKSYSELNKIFKTDFKKSIAFNKMVLSMN